MVKRISLLSFILFIYGCGGVKQGVSFIKKVNADDKSFRGRWVYKSQISGQFTYSVRTRIYIEANGKRFHLVARWTEANPPGERRTEEWIYDGKVLWQILSSQKQAHWFGIKGSRMEPFWKIPSRTDPFPPPQETGREDIIAGRVCKVLQTGGKYDKGYVTLTYWVDKEKNLLLKKEHAVEAGGLMLIHETYECESIEFDPAFSEGTFEVDIPPDWIKVERRLLDSELLKTKF